MNIRIAIPLRVVFAFPASREARELFMVKGRGCLWCARWDRDIGPIYPTTPEAKAAPPRRFDMVARS